jgi:hypothetical protein
LLSISRCSILSNQVSCPHGLAGCVRDQSSTTAQCERDFARRSCLRCRHQQRLSEPARKGRVLREHQSDRKAGRHSSSRACRIFETPLEEYVSKEIDIPEIHRLSIGGRFEYQAFGADWRDNGKAELKCCLGSFLELRCGLIERASQILQEEGADAPRSRFIRSHI